MYSYPVHSSLTWLSSSASLELENFLLSEPNALLASPSLSGEATTFGSGMSPMNLRIMIQMSREAWREGGGEEGGREGGGREGGRREGGRREGGREGGRKEGGERKRG